MCCVVFIQFTYVDVWFEKCLLMYQGSMKHVQRHRCNVSRWILLGTSSIITSSSILRLFFCESISLRKDFKHIVYFGRDINGNLLSGTIPISINALSRLYRMYVWRRSVFLSHLHYNVGVLKYSCQWFAECDKCKSSYILECHCRGFWEQDIMYSSVNRFCTCCILYMLHVVHVAWRYISSDWLQGFPHKSSDGYYSHRAGHAHRHHRNVRVQECRTLALKYPELSFLLAPTH